MGVGEGGVDLDGSGVALHGTIDILHLLEGVPHVAVSICKVGMDPAHVEETGLGIHLIDPLLKEERPLLQQHPPNGFLVVQEGIAEFALHL